MLLLDLGNLLISARGGTWLFFLQINAEIGGWCRKDLCYDWVLLESPEQIPVGGFVLQPSLE